MNRTSRFLSLFRTRPVDHALAPNDTGIQEIYALLNPEKLAYLQKQLAARK
jgi:hypothetical protein